MKYLIWVIIIFVAAAAITEAAHNQAYLVLFYQPYKIEFSLNLFVCALLLLFVLSYSLIRLMIATAKLPQSVRQFRIKRQQEKTQLMLDNALSAFFEGRYADAENIACGAIKAGHVSPFHTIIAASAAHELKRYDKRDAYLLAGNDGVPSDMQLMVNARFLLDQKEALAALKLLQELRSRRHIGVLVLELAAQQQLANWEEVLQLLNVYEKQQGANEAQLTQWRMQAWMEKINQQQTIANLEDCLRNLPGALKMEHAVVKVAVHAYMRLGAGAQAQEMIAESLSAAWSSDLAELYGDCVAEDILSQIKQAEKWLVQHKNDAQLLLTLGKLCLHQNLWGKAQSYLDASISILPSYSAYNTLAQLALQTGKTAEAEKYKQQSLLFKQ